MDELEDVYRESILLLETLQKLNELERNRDQIIQAVQFHMNQRDELLATISGPYSEEEIILGKSIVKINQEIKRRMEELYYHIKKDLKYVQQRKAQNFSYIHPYGIGKTIDGIYVDRKS